EFNDERALASVFHAQRKEQPLMRKAQPSQIVAMVAAARAAHLVVDREPFIFRDTMAASLPGEQGEEIIAYHRAYGDYIVLSGTRAQVTTRADDVERRLAEPAGGGVDQYVILGAGLDTFALRAPAGRPVRVFEVDHPATQRWKRELMVSAGLTTPPSLSFVPVDFETDDLMDALVA